MLNLPSSPKKGRNRLPQLLRAVVIGFLVFQMSSCVPLVVGGVAGYVAHAQGFGKIGPVGGGEDKTYGYGSSPSYQSAPAYDDSAAYEYEAAPNFEDTPVY